MIIIKKIIICLLLLFIFSIKVNATDLAKNAKSAILIETTTGKILFEKNMNEKRSPASMTKIMTLLLTVEALEKGNIKLSDQVFVSKNASGMGGTQIFVEANSYISLENLIKGIGIASANDASVAIAEYIGGTVENFVSLMNKRAKELGCKNTNFMNPHGLDEENHYTTAYDMSLISRELIKHDYILNITSTYEDHIMVSNKEQWLVNTNKLVKFYKGVDGLKTGYTDKAMYCLTATMNRNNMRLISVVMGEDTKEHRSSDTVSLLEYGYSMYGSKVLIEKKDYEGNMYVPNASNREIKYYLKDDVKLIVDKNVNKVDYEVEEVLDNVKAPLEKNSKVGTLYLKTDNQVYEYDLIIKKDIKKANFLRTYSNILKDIISGNINTIF